MKNLVLNLCLVSSGMAFGLSDYSSQTVVQLRSGAQNLALWLSEAGASNLQLTSFYQQNCGDQSKLAQYFLLNNKSEVTVKGDAVSLTDRDIRAEWLGLPDTYNGVLKLSPQQKRVGAIVRGERRLDHYFKSKFWKHFWVGLQVGVESAEQCTGAESVGAGSDDQLLAQLNRAELQYGRIGTSQTTSAGASDIRLILGADYLAKRDLHLGLQSFLLIPGSWNQPTPAQMFTATHGVGKHCGLGFDVQVQLPVLSYARSELNVYLRAEAIGLFKNHQLRVMDLKANPWSRFLILNKSDGTGSVPATTVLTQQVAVNPYATGELMFGMQYCYRALQFDLSYGLWGHGSERIELVNDFVTAYAIAGSAANKSASASTIATQAADDTTFTVIQKSDLNLDSASARAVITHRLNSQIGVKIEGQKIDLAMNLGAFYELPQNNAMVKQWGSYLNLSAIF